MPPRTLSPSGSGPRPVAREILAWTVALSGLILLLEVLNGVYRVMNMSRGSSHGLDWSLFSRMATYSPWLSWVPLLPLMAWAALRFSLEPGHLSRAILRHAGMMLLLVPLLMLSGALLGRLLFPGGASGPLARELFSPLLDPWLAVRFAGTVTYHYVLCAGLVHVVNERRLRRETLRRRNLLEAQLSRAQLDSLKMQLHPHFLFNALNALSTLIKRDPAEARRMAGLLEGLLQRALEESDLHEVTLARELEMLEAYLRIEQIRFSGHLEVRIEVSEEASKALVPHFILQPLVENAVRHGISPKTTPGWIRIRATLSADRLSIRVEDDGVGPEPQAQDREGGGIGLSNTRARLAQAYGDRATLLHGPRPDGGFLVELELPLKVGA